MDSVAEGYCTIGAVEVAAPTCAAGYYSNSGGVPCTPAPSGSYDSGTGNTSSTPCAAGTYQPNAGSVSCDLAQPGNYVASSGSATETRCAAGYNQPSSGQSSCLEAGAGYYVPTSGATSETMCPAGYSSNPGATACTGKPTIKKFKPAKGTVGKKVTITPGPPLAHRVLGHIGNSDNTPQTRRLSPKALIHQT